VVQSCSPLFQLRNRHAAAFCARMSRWKRPLKAAEVRKILRALGFDPKPLKATSHEQWTKRDGNHFCKVTLSAHNEPFDDFIVKSMAR
jgi:predicted RNA binding protein YcfA (HicA-like mRNA interferase family)